jgi:hypothetical protein
MNCIFQSTLSTKLPFLCLIAIIDANVDVVVVFERHGRSYLAIISEEIDLVLLPKRFARTNRAAMCGPSNF